MLQKVSNVKKRMIDVTTGRLIENVVTTKSTQEKIKI